MSAGPAADRAALLAALAWQVEMGADEAIGDAPVDRFAQPAETAPGQSRAAGDVPDATVRARGTSGDARSARGAEEQAVHDGAGPGNRAGGTDAGAGSSAGLAAGADTLEDLAAAMRDWEGSDLRHGARNFVFADGNPQARLMVIGEAPGADEDRIGRPFVGRAGQLLDRMLAAIGLSRGADEAARSVYIVNILPWRPAGNRTPSEAEVAAFLPFVERHIALASPDVLFTVGNTPTRALLGTAQGIKRMRGTWHRHGPSGRPLLPSFHPAYLLRQPLDKRLAWQDLQALAGVLAGRAPPV